MNLIGATGLFAAAQALFLVAMLSASRPRFRLENQALIALALCLSVYYATFFLANAGAPVDGRIFLVAHVQLLFGPLLYLHVTSSLSARRQLALRDFLHFIPALLAVAGSALLFSPVNEGGALYRDHAPMEWERTLYGVFCSLHVLAYCAVSRRSLRLAGGDVQRADWLRNLVFIFICLGVSRLSAELLIHFWGMTVGARQTAVMLSGLLFLYFVALRGQSQPAVPAPETAPVADVEKPAPARHSGLSAMAAERLLARLDEHVQAEHIYLDADLKLPALASRLGVSPEQLSEALNVYRGVRLSDYLGELRARHAAKLLADPSLESLSLLDIAMQSGFNSKATFNRQFKQRLGVTPSEYRRQAAEFA